MLLLSLALSVPLTVASASPGVGLRLERLGLLTNPEARRPPRALARAAETQAFARLAPAPAAAAAAAPAWPLGAASWAMGRPRAVLAMGALVFGLLSVLPRVGTAPEVPAWLRAQQDLLSMLVNTDLASEPKVAIGADASMNMLLAVRDRPARRIDDAVRRRARVAVQRALALEAEGAATEVMIEES
jgi:membrane glycosyltransferase